MAALNTYGGYLAPHGQNSGDANQRQNSSLRLRAPGAKAISAGAFIAMAARKIYMAPTAPAPGPPKTPPPA